MKLFLGLLGFHAAFNITFGFRYGHKKLYADGVPCIYLYYLMKYHTAVARCRTNSTKQSIILLIFMLVVLACTLNKELN